MMNAGFLQIAQIFKILICVNPRDPRETESTPALRNRSVSKFRSNMPAAQTFTLHLGSKESLFNFTARSLFIPPNSYLVNRTSYFPCSSPDTSSPTFHAGWFDDIRNR